MSGIKDYSLTPSSNSTISGINLAENVMLPSDVNNAIRQEMADTREFFEAGGWINLGYTPVYSSATAVTISGADATAYFVAHRRVKAVGSSTGTIYGSVASSSFSTNTTVNFTWDSGTLANETLTIYVGWVAPAGLPIPTTAVSGVVTGVTAGDTSITVAGTSAAPTVAVNGAAAMSWSGIHSYSAAINEAKGADIASATTTDIGAATGNFVNVTGTTTITGLGTVQAGTRRIVNFTGALTLTYNATSLILPGAASITTAAGDIAEFVSLGSGNWVCASYTKASGYAVKNALEYVTTVSPGGTAAAVFTGFVSGYDYIIVGNKVCFTDGASMYAKFSTDGGSTYSATSYYYVVNGSHTNNTTFIDASGGYQTGLPDGTIEYTLFNPAGGSTDTAYSYVATMGNSAYTAWNTTANGGWWASTTAVTAMKFYSASASNFSAAATFLVYRRKRG